MSVQERIIYAKLIIALARDDIAEVQRIHFEEQGVRTKKMDPKVGYLFSCFYNDRDTHDICQGMNIANFIDYLEAQDPMVRVPEEYLMASRVSIMMRGMGKAFGLQLRMSKLWESEAAAFLKSQGVDY
jgi:aarF domain-containing kinase